VAIAIRGAGACGRGHVRACRSLVARCAGQRCVVDHDRVLLALGHGSELERRPGAHYFLLTDACEATDADDGVGHFAVAVDQELVDLAYVLTLSILDTRTDDVLRLVLTPVLPYRGLRIASVGSQSGLDRSNEGRHEQHHHYASEQLLHD